MWNIKVEVHIFNFFPTFSLETWKSFATEMWLTMPIFFYVAICQLLVQIRDFLKELSWCGRVLPNMCLKISCLRIFSGSGCICSAFRKHIWIKRDCTQHKEGKQMDTPFWNLVPLCLFVLFSCNPLFSPLRVINIGFLQTAIKSLSYLN